MPVVFFIWFLLLCIGNSHARSLLCTSKITNKTQPANCMHSMCVFSSNGFCNIYVLTYVCMSACVCIQKKKTMCYNSLRVLFFVCKLQTFNGFSSQIHPIYNPVCAAQKKATTTTPTAKHGPN